MWLARLRLRGGQVWGLRVLYRLPGSENASFRSLWIFPLAAEEAGAPSPSLTMIPKTDKRPAATNHSIGGGVVPEKFFRKNREFTWGGGGMKYGTPPAGICPPAPRSIETTPPLPGFFSPLGLLAVPAGGFSSLLPRHRGPVDREAPGRAPGTRLDPLRAGSCDTAGPGKPPSWGLRP